MKKYRSELTYLKTQKMIILSGPCPQGRAEGEAAGDNAWGPTSEGGPGGAPLIGGLRCGSRCAPSWAPTRPRSWAPMGPEVCPDGPQRGPRWATRWAPTVPQSGPPKTINGGPCKITKGHLPFIRLKAKKRPLGARGPPCSLVQLEDPMLLDDPSLLEGPITARTHAVTI